MFRRTCSGSRLARVENGCFTKALHAPHLKITANTDTDGDDESAMEDDVFYEQKTYEGMLRSSFEILLSITTRIRPAASTSWARRVVQCVRPRFRMGAGDPRGSTGTHAREC